MMCFKIFFSDSFLASIDILHYIYNGLAINQNTSEKQESNQDWTQKDKIIK